MSSRPAAIEALLGTATLWRGRADPGARPPAVAASGWPTLDALLPGGGWPLGNLIEVGIARPGSGETALFLPLLAASTGRIVLVDPPFLPYAPGLAQAGIGLARLWWIRTGNARERLWATEQTLRSGVAAAVLCWPERLDPGHGRRLQLAAEAGAGLGLCFRPRRELEQTSHAPLRLSLSPEAGHWRIDLLKCRGRTGGTRLHLARA
ncbi:MAG: translesion DNA synthesis-associated protein ImuA [Lysobacterales bacterium]